MQLSSRKSGSKNSDDEDSADFRPLFGGKPAPPPKPRKWSSLAAEAFMKKRGTLRPRESRIRPLGPSGHSDAVRPGMRPVTIKAFYTRLPRPGAPWRAKRSKLTLDRHLRYMERDGVEKDGSKGSLYDAEGRVDRASFQTARDGEELFFRITISPAAEDGERLDMTAFVRELMSLVERETGRRLEWAAANHYNTAVPHAHVVIRGVDLDGQQVRFSREYISNGMRWRAQEITTRILGRRNAFEIRRSHAREVTQERFTSLDRELQRLAAHGKLQGRSPTRRSAIEPTVLIGRLKHLEKMGLARELKTNRWQLADNLEPLLRALGERGDILKQIHRAVRGDTSLYRSVRDGEALPDRFGGIETDWLVGRVADKGLADEEKGTLYAVFETPDGSAYHVPLGPEHDEAARVGDLVRFRTDPEPAATREDVAIAEDARHHGGVYALPADVAGGHASKLSARLRVLEREGLAVQSEPGRWQVPADLLAQLEARRAARPRHRLQLEAMPLALEAQVRARAPVWLDSLEPDTLARHGFGAKLAERVERRGAFLRELGIDPDDPARADKLREVDRRAVGKEFGRQVGKRFVDELPQHFHGQAVVLEQAPYLAVMDGANVVLVPAPPDARSLHGKTVVLERDAQGAVVVTVEDPARAMARQERERFAAGEKLARESGKVFVSDVPAPFRGQLRPGPEGLPYVAVVDERRLLLVPETPEARAWAREGRSVVVDPDERGGARLRAPDVERARERPRELAGAAGAARVEPSRDVRRPAPGNRASQTGPRLDDARERVAAVGQAPAKASPEERSRPATSVAPEGDVAGGLVATGKPARAETRPELDVRTVGEAFLREHPALRRFLPDIPHGFQGEVRAGPKGLPYVAVVDDDRRFVLVPETPEARALAMAPGRRRVVVERDEGGTFRVREFDRRRDRDDRDRGR